MVKHFCDRCGRLINSFLDCSIVMVESGWREDTDNYELCKKCSDSLVAYMKDTAIKADEVRDVSAVGLEFSR